MGRFRNRCLLLAAACLLFSCTEREEHVRIAAPEDLCGLLASHLAGDAGLVDGKYGEEVFPLTDCCSTTTEWAMSSDRIDAAWLCPDAARALLDKDSRFQVIGPALVNSQIFVIRDEGREPVRIAYSHKREYQRRLIRERFGRDCEAIPVMSAALPYVYEQGKVDGIVIDVIKGVTLKGRHLSLSGDGTDIVTYVLVASKAFYGSERFPRFCKALRESATRLNDGDVLAGILTDRKQMTPVEARLVASLPVRFIPPSPCGKR